MRSLCCGYGCYAFSLELYEVSEFYYQIDRQYRGETSRVIRGIIGDFKQANRVFKEYLAKENKNASDSRD